MSANPEKGTFIIDHETTPPTISYAQPATEDQLATHFARQEDPGIESVRRLTPRDMLKLLNQNGAIATHRLAKKYAREKNNQ